MASTQTMIAAVALLTGSILSLPSAHAQVTFANTRFVSQKDARHTESEKGTLTLKSDERNLTFEAKDHSSLVIPYDQITSLALDQSVTRIRTPFTGRVQHDRFLTVIYQGAGSKPGYAVLHLNGRSYRQVVAALEAETSKPVTEITN